MTTRATNWPAGTPCWVDVAVDDVGRARTFYSTLLGWEIEAGDPELGDYASCTKDGRAVAGLSPKMTPDAPSAWTTYLATDDVGATTAKVVEAGGQLVAEPMPVGDLGTMALAIDPGGAFVGFWEGAKHTGFELANEPGSVTWNENFSRAWKQNQGFYTALFGWEYDDMSGPDFEYATFKVDGRVAGGIGQLGPDMPTEVPPHWSTYFKVADTDVAVAEVQRLGGTAVRQAWDTPFGRMAAVTDDQGVQFMLMADVRG